MDEPSWRDEPVTKGELYDALIAASDDVESRTKSVESRYSGRTKQLLRYSSAVQNDLLRKTAAIIKGDNE